MPSGSQVIRTRIRLRQVPYRLDRSLDPEFLIEVVEVGEACVELVSAAAVPELEVSWPLRPGEAALEVGVVLPEAVIDGISVDPVNVAPVPVVVVPEGGPLDFVVLIDPAKELGIPGGVVEDVAAVRVVLAAVTAKFWAKPNHSQNLYSHPS